MRVLVLGAAGMLGHTVFRHFLTGGEHEVWGTLRTDAAVQFFPSGTRDRLMLGVDALDHDAVVNVLATVRPGVVINCVGLVKQLPHANSPVAALPINALLPHRLASLCTLVGARLVHVSTDCVFSGRKGGYREEDASDAEDVYGRSKYLARLPMFRAQ